MNRRHRNRGMADRLYRCSRRQFFPMIILCVGNGLWAGTVVVVALGSRFMIDAATQSNRSIFPESRKKCFYHGKTSVPQVGPLSRFFEGFFSFWNKIAGENGRFLDVFLKIPGSRDDFSKKNSIITGLCFVVFVHLFPVFA